MDVVISASSARGYDPTCSGGSTPSSDKCRVNVDQTCPSPGGTYTTIGIVSWSTDGSSAAGTLSYSKAGVPSCAGVYGATFTRI